MKPESTTGLGTDKPSDIMPTMCSPQVFVFDQAFKSANIPPEGWSPAPLKTEWGDGMMVADVEITKDETLTMYAHKDVLALIHPERAVGDRIGINVDLPERVIETIAGSHGIPGPFSKSFFSFCQELKNEVIARMPKPYEGPKKFTSLEVQDGNKGIRWVTAEGVMGQPTGCDVRAYLEKRPYMLECRCALCNAFYGNIDEPSAPDVSKTGKKTPMLRPLDVWNLACKQASRVSIDNKMHLMFTTDQAAILSGAFESEGEVVVTTNAEGVCVAVARQDSEHRILKTIWERPARKTLDDLIDNLAGEVSIDAMNHPDHPASREVIRNAMSEAYNLGRGYQK